MAVAKKKPKIQASEVAIGNRTLDVQLLDMMEQIKENAARADERTAELDKKTTIALQTIAAVMQDLCAITQEMREFNKLTDARLNTLEKAGGISPPGGE
jgi:hypothetical protein